MGDKVTLGIEGQGMGDYERALEPTLNDGSLKRFRKLDLPANDDIRYFLDIRAALEEDAEEFHIDRIVADTNQGRMLQKDCERLGIPVVIIEPITEEEVSLPHDAPAADGRISNLPEPAGRVYPVNGRFAEDIQGKL